MSAVKHKEMPKVLVGDRPAAPVFGHEVSEGGHQAGGSEHDRHGDPDQTVEEHDCHGVTTVHVQDNADDGGTSSRGWR